MAATLDGQLVVAISSRALFDFEEENRVFEDGLAQVPAPGAKKDAAGPSRSQRGHAASARTRRPFPPGDGSAER